MTLSKVSELAWHMVDPRGRCNRKGLLIVAGLLLATEILVGSAIWLLEADLNGGAVFAIKLLFVWTAICAGSKRLHDLDLRAWWMVGMLGITTVWTLLLVVAMAVTLGTHVLQPGTGWYFTALALSSLPIFAATLWIHFRKGQGGLNRFGTEPKGLGFSGPLPDLRPIHEALYRLQRMVMPVAA
jgi:uncharacterized membrane protein YhaH (DUF805 family)